MEQLPADYLHFNLKKEVKLANVHSAVQWGLNIIFVEIICLVVTKCEN